MVVNKFLVAFGARDFGSFMPYFADEATIFLPPAARGPVERAGRGLLLKISRNACSIPVLP
jgi:hypothetical protein